MDKLFKDFDVRLERSFLKVYAGKARKGLLA
jgi:hypothetical protein